MITPEEREEIINAAVERALLAIPEVIGSLMTNHANMAVNNKKFYTDHPEFKDHRDLVAKVIEEIEGKNTLIDHKMLLEKAVPEIRRRIPDLKRLDVTTVSKPDLGVL